MSSLFFRETLFILCDYIPLFFGVDMGGVDRGERRYISNYCMLTLIELPMRFVMICRNLPGSPISISGTLSEM